MFCVTYVKNNALWIKNSLQTEKIAREWIKEQGDNIRPLKLLDCENFDCPETVETFSDDIEGVTAVQSYKTIYV